MKHLLTALACMIAMSISAQSIWPWNPDSNSDEFIGFADILDLLAIYGDKFYPENVICSVDSSEALYHTGNMFYAQCHRSCSELPGTWKVPSDEEMYQHDLSQLNTGLTWIRRDIAGAPLLNTDSYRSMYIGYSNANDGRMSTEDYSITRECYCSTQERRKVEYDYCFGSDPTSLTFLDCIEEKLADGWYPLSGWISDFTKQGYGNRWGGGSNSPVHDARIAPVAKSHAAFWRWAE